MVFLITRTGTRHYVSPDSSDLWTHPELFQTDGQMHLTHVAGCPPDAFAADGQLWGNPLYDWPAHKATGFDCAVRIILSANSICKMSLSKTKIFLFFESENYV